MNSALEVLTFSARKQDGQLPVLDTDGRPVAWIQVPWGGRRFTAVLADGSALCSGRTRLFNRSLDVLDAADAPLLSLRPHGWGRRRLVTFAGGAELLLAGVSWADRDWTLSDPAGRVVADLGTSSGGLFSSLDHHTVRVGDPTLTLAELVGIVQGLRILLQAERARRRANS